MDDDRQFSPPEPIQEINSPWRRITTTGLRWLVVILVVFGSVAVIAVILSRDDDRQLAAEMGAAEQIGVEQLEGLAKEPAEVASQGVEMTPAGPASQDEQGTTDETPTVEATLIVTLTAVPTGEPSVALTMNPTPIPTTTLAPSPAGTPAPIPTVGPIATPSAGRGAGTSLGTGRIVIVDDRSRLWTVAADGSDRRLLSEPGRSYQFPSWSPVGKDIAVIGNELNSGGIFILPDEEDSAARQLYSDPVSLPIYLYWSPDGENVSFIASHSGGLALHMAPSSGLVGSQIVTTSPSTLFWDWVPDGRQVLVHTGFTAREADDSRLVFVPLDRSDDEVEINQQGFFQAPVVDANGRFFSFGDRDPIGNHWLSVRDIDQDQQIEFIRHMGVLAMGFSPTRAQLAFTSPVEQTLSFYGPLRLLDLESGESRLLVPEEVMAFFWSPDGRSIAYFALATMERPFDLKDAPVAGFTGQELSVSNTAVPGSAKKKVLARIKAPPAQEMRLGLSVSIVDVDSGDTRLLTVFEPGNLFLNQFMPFFDQYALSHRLWSPDSEALVLPMQDEQGLNFIVVVPVDGSDPIPISHGVAAFWSQQ